MEYASLGTTGIQIGRLSLGALSFGAAGNSDHDDCIRIIHAALAAGINFVDTADVYNGGESEQIVGQALKGRRDQVVLATKVRMPMSDDRNERGASRRWIRRECEASLRRLGTDYIDVYQIHRPDPRTHLDETLAVMSDLIHDGKILYAGTSMFTAAEIVEGQWLAERRCRERFVTEQPLYSILSRGAEYDVLPTCRRFGIGAISWGPLHSGWLTDRVRQGGAHFSGTRSTFQPHMFDLGLEFNQRKLRAAESLAELATGAGVSLIHLAIAFALEHPAIASVIIGPRTMEQLESQLGAVDVRLKDDLLDEIDQIVPPGETFSYLDLGPIPPSLGDRQERRRR